MAHLVAMLRAVNLGPHNKISSAELKELAKKLKLGAPRTLLASGNLIVRDDGHDPAQLEAKLEKAIHDRHGIGTEVFVRDAKELRKLVDGNPFEDAARDDPSHLVALFLKSAPKAAAVKALRAAIVGREIVEPQGRHLVAHYVDGIGESKLTNKVIEKHLGGACTGRNWNTVRKLLALAQED